MRRYKKEYRLLKEIYEWCSKENAANREFESLREETEENYTREQILQAMHAVYGSYGGRKFKIDTWFNKAYSICDHIEWLSEIWQFKVVLEKLLRETPEDVKCLPQNYLGFIELQDI